MNTMTVTAVLIAALIMTLIYSRTRHPVLYCFLNTLAGCCALILMKTVFTGSAENISFLSASAAAVLGVPGALLGMILPLL